MIVLRSLLFLLAQAVITPVFYCIALGTFPFKPFTRYRIISTWSRLIIALAGVICGIHYRIEGKENIPDKPCIVMSKHQSAWETLAFQVISTSCGDNFRILRQVATAFGMSLRLM
jgi:1-acyl-sn-glycerol-3-phosphate acyltransferase